MRSYARAFWLAIVGFAGVFVAVGIGLSIVDGLTFQPSEEFATAGQAVRFSLFIRCVYVPGLCGAGFAAAIWPSIPLRRALPVPALLGFLGGLGCFTVGGLGALDTIQGTLGLSQPFAFALLGFFFGAGALAVAVFARPRRESRAPGS